MWATVRAWAGSAEARRCKWCRKPIVWVMTEAGKSMPFNLGFTIREIVRHPETQAKFMILDKDDKHECAERRDARRDAAGNVLTKDRKPRNRRV